MTRSSVRIGPSAPENLTNKPIECIIGSVAGRPRLERAPSKISRLALTAGGVPERPKGADCKSAGERLRRFESFPLHHYCAHVAQ